MKPATVIFTLVVASMSSAQDETAALNAAEQQPIYRLMVVSRTTKAINYGHRSEPTKVDFRGTVLMPEAHGEALIESQRGVMAIKTRFDRVAAPTRFGPEYLTYVVWAISPEGRPANLGELVLNSSNKGRLAIATHLQAFALIVTAEPYFAVTQPSDVVVMENVVRPDTVGKIEELNAKYELLPRKQFTYDTAARVGVPDTPKVSVDQYEALLALYQAQNALQIAKAAEADRYASESFQKAEQLYRQAQNYQSQKSASKHVVMTAREATQAAEDARAISVKRQEVQKNVNQQ
jgi:hypothetical protein